jgi:ATP-dependent helicase/nuclease subunit A
MDSPREKKSLTSSQQRAIAARGNVLVMAGAGTGKTHTLVERCLNLLSEEKIPLNEILIVTFTEAAAAEMRSRLRMRIVEKSQSENVDFWREQLALFDLAHIGTLHSFCFALIRENFHRLGLDPQLSILDEAAASQLAAETLDKQFTAHYESKKAFSAAVQSLIQTYGHGRDEKIRELILRLHHYSQTRSDAEIWLAQQIKFFSAPEPTRWREWFFSAIQNWREEWWPVLENLKSENVKAAELFSLLKNLPEDFSRAIAADFLKRIILADGKANFPAGKFGALRKPLEKFFDETKFLHSYACVENGSDPLAEDWDWIRGHMQTLLQLAQEFAEDFSERKRDTGVLDFHDLEQFALKLLRAPEVAKKWREKFRFVFVDEYQDINVAQDKIIQCLSGEAENANRFLVGDVKQSIYRFRLADPKIFRGYAKNWRDQTSQTIPLSENFRSRESLLHFANSLFALVMREEIGGINYDADAHLKFGSPETRGKFSLEKNSAPRTELLLRLKNRADEKSEENSEIADLEESQKEARLVAWRLKKLAAENHEIWDDTEKKFRSAEWRDIAILLRAPRGKAEIFAREFSRAEIPLIVARGGFFDSSEILDLLSLLELLDNPLQDVPCISVLRSPLVGLTLDALAEIRLAARGHFWFALNQVLDSKSKIKTETRAKIEKFLERFSRWRKLVRQVSLSQCLEIILAETHYADWLKSRSRGAQLSANLSQFLKRAQSFDQFQRQGLFHFLKLVAAQRELEIEPDVPAVAAQNAVRLMSIHQSKGLEFPVVVLADLGKNFNEQDLRAEIIFDEELGLCPRVKPPQTSASFSSLPHWLAQKNQRREMRGEELRLLYVALTRARDTLILTGTLSQKSWETIWHQPPGEVTLQKIANAKSFADWLGIWFAQQAHPPSPSSGTTKNETQGDFEHLQWRIVDDLELVEKFEIQNFKSAIEIPSLDEMAAEKLCEVLNWNYPFLAATQRAAKTSVTTLRRAAQESSEEAEKLFFSSSLKFSAGQNQKLKIESRKLNAAKIGAAHHKFLQFVALEKITDLAAEAERLTREKILSPEEKSVLDLPALAVFWHSEIGRKIAAQPKDFVKRELQFTARFSPAELAEIAGQKNEAGLENEFVVVQGVADLVVLLPREIWLVDFKTDDFGESELPEKIKIYKPQLQLYAAALEKICARPVTLRTLHFLAARKTVEI